MAGPLFRSLLSLRIHGCHPLQDPRRSSSGDKGCLCDPEDQ